MDKTNILKIAKEVCPHCHSDENQGEGKGMFPVCKGHFRCSNCDEIYNTNSSFYKKEYKSFTGEYWVKLQ